jgi:hypothetical protein
MICQIKILQLFIIILLSFIFLSCSSGNGNPVLQSASEYDISQSEIPIPGDNLPMADIDKEDPTRTLLGIYTLEFDPTTATAAVYQDRQNCTHYNVTAYLPVQIVITGYHPETDRWNVNVKITNPYQIDGYDLRLILYTDGYDNDLISPDPDGWTNQWDIPGGLIINPFIAYAKDHPERIFAAGSQHDEYMGFHIPPGNPPVRFAIDVSLPGHSNDPYMIGFFGHQRLVETQGSQALAQVDVYDWQDDVNCVALHCPTITGEQLTYFTQIDSNIWRGTLVNNNGVPPGSYSGIIYTTSQNSQNIASCEFVTIRIKKDVTADWTIFYYIFDLQSGFSNMEEMSEVGTIDGKLNLVAVIDWQYSPEDTIWEIPKAPDEFIQINDMGEVIPPEGINNPDPDVLTRLFRWGMREYPARNYGLIVFSHGNAGIYSFPPDKTFLNDIEIQDLSDALKIALDENPDIDRLEFITIESCTMSWIEAAYRMRDVCRVGMASEFLMNYGTADYDEVLLDFVENIETKDGYDWASLYVNNVLGNPMGAGTYAAWDSDLTASAVIPEINNFSQELINALPEYRDDIEACRIDSDDWGSECLDPRITDLGYFAEKIIDYDLPLPAELVQAAINLRQAMDIAVFENGIDFPGEEGCYKSATGWQILLTDHFNDPDPDYQYVRDVITNIGFAEATLWDEFLIAYDDNDY